EIELHFLFGYRRPFLVIRNAVPEKDVLPVSIQRLFIIMLFLIQLAETLPGIGQPFGRMQLLSDGQRLTDTSVRIRIVTAQKVYLTCFLQRGPPGILVV